jgi:AraC-like DNA-binding protein
MTDAERERRLTELKDTVLAVIRRSGAGATGIESLQTYIHTAPEVNPNCFYRLSVGLILQGKKRVTCAGRSLEYGAGAAVITASDLPTSFEILTCSESRPFVAVSLELDPVTVTELIAQLPAALREESGSEEQVLTVTDASADLIDGFARLFRLLDAPEQIPLRLPLIERDLLCALLMSPAGAGLRRCCGGETPTSGIARTISWIRSHPTESLNLDTLSEIARMSRTSLFRHFKSVTGFSPLQYQKRLCLYLAHNLMLSRKMSAAEAAYEVGYASTTQFSREYKKVFGLPPRKSLSEQSGQVAAKN